MSWTCFLIAGLRLFAPMALAAHAPDVVLLPGQSAHVLRTIQVDGDSDRLVITLTADGPLDGRLQQLSGGTTRWFVDLHGVRPQVDAVTPVNRGPVLRIRVGLNSALPPITRVVLDVSNAPPARIERGNTDRELRIIVGEAASATSIVGVPRDVAPKTKQERAWCLELAERLATRLKHQTPSTSQATMLAAVTAWESLEREVGAHELSASLQPIQFMLLQAVRLGRIATLHQNARESDQAAAALAGARLLLQSAQDRLARFP